MRVATRRLRAVLEIYAPCFPPKALRDVLRDVKALADALGERRDPDVQLAALGSSPRRVKDADRPGVEVFAERVRAEQGQGNEALAAALAELERDRPARRLAALSAAALARARPARSFGLQRPDGRVKAREVKGLDPAPRWPTTSSGSSPRAWTSCARSSRGARPRAHEGAARHAHRRQAPALHPRGRRRAVLRALRRDGHQAHQGPAGPARRDARLRRPAPARARAAGRAARRRRARGARARRRRARPRPGAGLGHAARGGVARPARRSHLPRGAPRAAVRALPASCGASWSARASARASSTRSPSGPDAGPNPAFTV